MTKHPTTVSLTVEQLQAIEEARAQRTRCGERPSRNAIVREAIALGLPLLVDGTARKAG